MVGDRVARVNLFRLGGISPSRAVGFMDISPACRRIVLVNGYVLSRAWKLSDACAGSPDDWRRAIPSRDLPMQLQRNRKLDLVGLALSGLLIFLIVALLSYDTSDPVFRWSSVSFESSPLVFPPRDTVQNACGYAGALVSGTLFTSLGLGAYYLIVSLGVVVGILLLHREVSEPVLRLLGWCLSLFGMATLAGMAFDSGSVGPVIGPGGYLGALGSGLLQMHFAATGGTILALSVILGGLLLCTDYFLLHCAAYAFKGSVWGARRGMRVVRRSRRSNDSTKTSDVPKRIKLEDENEEDEEEVSDESTPLQVRVSGKSVDAEDVEDPDVPSGDESEPEQGRSIKKRLADAIRIKNPKTRKADRDVSDQLDAASRDNEGFDYQLPSRDLLLETDAFDFETQTSEVRKKAKILEKTFKNFGFNVKVVEIETGPVIAQYEVELEAGLRLSKITGLADDLAIALRVPSVRVVAPIPGKNTVGIEAPNAQRQLVRLREVMDEADAAAKKMQIPIFLGKDVSGNAMTVDLTTLPHLLIAGRTGTGKSVCLNTIIMSMLMARRPDEVKMLLIDPKMVELSPYGKLPHLMHPVVTDMKKAEAILAWAVDKMEERYSLLARAGVRHMSIFNQLGREEILERLQPETEEEAELIPSHLPYIVIVADEMADLMMTAPKEVESHIIRLAQKSRAVGIHLILATQKPTVDVITGLIKSNLPARIAFQVASRTDSRVVLDEMGADKLLGNGDLLFLWPGTSTLHRGQGAYVSDDEIRDVVNVVSAHEPQFVSELVQLNTAGGDGAKRFQRDDELYEGAIEIVIREGRGSVSLLQRNLGIGYGRAARLIDYMAEDGVVGEYNGSQARDVLISPEEWAKMQDDGYEPEAAAPRSNKVQLAPRSNPDDNLDEDESSPVREEAASPGKRKRQAKKSRTASEDEDSQDLAAEELDDSTEIHAAAEEDDLEAGSEADEEMETEDLDDDEAYENQQCGLVDADDEFEDEEFEDEEEEYEEDEYDDDEYEEEDEFEDVASEEELQR